MKNKLIPLPQVSPHISSAEQCRLLKLKVGDTIQGRVFHNDMPWTEVRLKLLYCGRHCSFWKEWRRSSSHPKWMMTDDEAINWELCFRQWFKVQI